MPEFSRCQRVGPDVAFCGLARYVENLTSHGCPMAAGERIAQDVSGPLLALARGAALAAAMFAYAAPARADCSDVVNGVVNTASALDSPQCQTAFAESS